MIVARQSIAVAAALAAASVPLPYTRFLRCPSRPKSNSAWTIWLGLSQRLQSAGFSLQTPRTFESNVLYDTPDRQMRARTEILRIRSYAGRWT